MTFVQMELRAPILQTDILYQAVFLRIK